MTDSTQTTTSTGSEVLATIDAVYAAWAANDADALYTADATVVQPGVFKKNKNEIRSTMAAGFAGPLKGSHVLDAPLGGDFAPGAGSVPMRPARRWRPRGRI
jgi:ketosteroid isomerase-like protein